MKRDIEALSEQRFDLAVIGGGIQGAATAREAALRGLKVALVEARDFASGTSSRSSKLIHGGLRYLEQLDFKLVHEARRERRLLMKLAPHLARPQPFLLPIYQNDPFSSLKVRTGLTIYDLFGNLGKKDRHRMVRPDTAIGLVPALRAEGLEAAALYHDSTTDDARLTIENVLDASDHGAVVANYARLRALEVSAGGDGKDEITSGEVEDSLSGRRFAVAARFWVNAAGPWVDRVRALLPQFDGSNTVRLTKGTHVIVPAVTGRLALLAAVVPGDRIFLMVPWHGHALLGTTDTDFEGDPATVAPDAADAEYLLQAANRVLRRPLTTTDVKGSWAGVRALAIEPEKPGESPSAYTREYRFHEDPWVKNFISICGGKLTTARALGDKLVDQVAARLGAATNGVSSRTAFLPGGRTGAFGVFVNYAAWEAVRLYEVPYEIAERIVRTYGSRWRQVLEPIRNESVLGEPLPGEPGLLTAEVDFAIRQEMAVEPDDFLWRRSGLNWAAALTKEAAPAVEEIFARHSPARTRRVGDAGGAG